MITRLKHRFTLSTFLGLLIALIISAISVNATAAYTEASVAGTALESPTTNWAAGDDDTISVPIGFDFPFGGLTTVNTININSNGGLSLDAWSDFNNQALATASSSTVIAPYWDDLNRGTGTIKYETFGSAPNRRFVAAWNNVPRFPTTGSCTFQVVLYETGNIRFRYSTSSTSCDGSSATVGIQETSSIFIQHSFNAPITLSNDLLYTPVAPPPPPPGPATPLIVGSCDSFEDNLDNWTISESGGFVNVNTLTSQSPNRSLDINGGAASATSIVVDTSTNFKEVTLWIRRGADSFSEDTDNNEDLILEYLDSSNNWITLETFLGSGTKGQSYSRVYAMPNPAKHANFQLRLRMTQGSGTDYDHWHIDDVCLNPVTAYPSISLQKSSTVISDGYSGSNPKRIPGALVDYDIVVTNSGIGAADNDTIEINDSIPANTALYVNDISGAGTGPIRFTDGTSPNAPSGLTYNFTTLADTGDDLSFSEFPTGTDFSYVPTPDATGVDTSVKRIKIMPKGSFSATGISGDPTFSIKFRVIVQ